MPKHMKIATCCYCGTRAALVFDRRRHELACSACGAPLHELKMMPQPSANGPSKKGADRYPSQGYSGPGKPHKYEKPRRKKRGRRFGRKVLEEIWDVVEDIFD